MLHTGFQEAFRLEPMGQTSSSVSGRKRSSDSLVLDLVDRLAGEHSSCMLWSRIPRSKSEWVEQG